MSTLLTPKIIAKEALIVLENNLVLGSLVHRDYSKEFQNVGATVSVRKPTTFSSTAVSDTISLNVVTESSVNVVLDNLLDITVQITSKELSLDIVDFREQILAPAFRAHAQKVDALIAALYKDVAVHRAVSATPCAADLATLSALMSVRKVPLTDRRLVLNPLTQAGFVGNVTMFAAVDQRGDTLGLREASLGRVMGFDTYMDQNIASHTSGAHGDLAGSATVAWAVDTTAGTIDAITSGATIFAGDIFKFTGYDQQFVVSANATASASTVILTFQPKVEVAIPDDTVITFIDTHKANIAFHKNAFALVTAPLAPPIGGASAWVETYKGLSCRIVFDYLPMEKKNIMSMDLLCGVKTLDLNLAARLCDSN